MDFNPRTPTIQGMEPHPTEARSAGPFSVNNVGIMQRIKPGAVTPSHVHTYLADLLGSSGLGIELLSSPDPPIRTDEIHFPGSNTGATSAAWETLTNAAATFAAVDDQYDDTDGLRNIAAVPAANSIELKFRGNDTALTSKRIDRIQIYARMKLTATTSTGRGVRVRGRMNLGGVDSTYATGTVVPGDNLIYTRKIGDWQLNPSTGLPWTMAEANLLLSTAATDEFGLIADSCAIPLEGFIVYGLWMVVTTAPENRNGYFYQNTPAKQGWSRNALSGASAFSAATWYWLLVYALRGSQQGRFTIPFLVDNALPKLAAVGDVGEHRTGWHVGLTGPSGLVESTYAADFPALFPFLLESSGPTISTQSQPYAALDYLLFDSENGGSKGVDPNIPNRGQEITSAAGSNAYAGVTLPLWWHDVNVPPDQPLVVEVRYGAGALTGGGTLLATATLNAQTNVYWPNLNPGGANVFIPFDGGNATPPAGTQLFALIKSAALGASLGQGGAGYSRGWVTSRLDCRSNDLATGGGTTLANVEGQTFGGQTDSYAANGTEKDRYDIPISLTAPPAAPSGVTVTVREAA